MNLIFAFALFMIFRCSYHKLFLLAQANTHRPCLCYKCRLCRSFYALKNGHLTAWIFSTGLYKHVRSHICTLISLIYWARLHYWVTERVWKCQKVKKTVLYLHFPCTTVDNLTREPVPVLLSSRSKVSLSIKSTLVLIFLNLYVAVSWTLNQLLFCSAIHKGTWKPKFF